MVDALKNIMSTMTETVTRQVLEQVKRAMEAANSAKVLPHFDYVPNHGDEPYHRPNQVPSPERHQEVSRLNRSGRPYTKQLSRHAVAGPSGRPTRGAAVESTTASTLYTTHSRRIAWLEEHEQTSKHRGEISSKRWLSPEYRTHRDCA